LADGKNNQKFYDIFAGKIIIVLKQVWLYFLCWVSLCSTQPTVASFFPKFGYISCVGFHFVQPNLLLLP